MEQVETFILNRYAASELAGALILGKMARKTNDAYLRRQLTWHCAEEARHAAIWEGLIEELNLKTLPIHDSSGKGYFTYFKEVKDMTDFLAFVHVYELRVPFHFGAHAKWTKSERIKEVLNKLIKEEDSHLSWIHDILLKEMENNREKVLTSLKKFSEIEEKSYQDDLHMLKSVGGSALEFAQAIEDALHLYKGVFADGTFK